MARNQTSARRLAAAARGQAAVELRLSGLTYTEIAEQVGCSRALAHNYVMGAMTQARGAVAEAAEAALRLELDRLDALHAAIWPDALAGGLAAIDRAIKIMERRAKLLGLDAKETRQPTDGKTLAEQFVEFAAALPQ